MSSIRELIDAIDARFVSGNEVSVERAHIKRAEWDEIHALLAHIKPARYELTEAGRALLAERKEGE